MACGFRTVSGLGCMGGWGGGFRVLEFRACTPQPPSLALIFVLSPLVLVLLLLQLLPLLHENACFQEAIAKLKALSSPNELSGMATTKFRCIGFGAHRDAQWFRASYSP